MWASTCCAYSREKLQSPWPVSMTTSFISTANLFGTWARKWKSSASGKVSPSWRVSKATSIYISRRTSWLAHLSPPPTAWSLRLTLKVRRESWPWWNKNFSLVILLLSRPCHKKNGSTLWCLHWPPSLFTEIVERMGCRVQRQSRRIVEWQGHWQRKG